MLLNNTPSSSYPSQTLRLNQTPDAPSPRSPLRVNFSRATPPPAPRTSPRSVSSLLSVSSKARLSVRSPLTAPRLASRLGPRSRRNYSYCCSFPRRQQPPLVSNNPLECKLFWTFRTPNHPRTMPRSRALPLFLKRL